LTGFWPLLLFRPALAFSSSPGAWAILRAAGLRQARTQSTAKNNFHARNRIAHLNPLAKMLTNKTGLI